MAAKPKIAVLGIITESNVFAPVAGREDYEQKFWTESHEHGTEILNLFEAFAKRQDEWEIIPIVLGNAEACGPTEHSFFESTCAKIDRQLQEKGPFDGVYILGHGAGVTTEIRDLDGAYFKVVRDAVKDTTPIVAFLDLHGNVSTEMIKAVNVLLSMHKNPHTDITKRIEDTAQMLELLLAGTKTHTAWRSVPLLTPQVSQLTAAGEPFGDLLSWSLQMADQDEAILDVSILPGFAFNDAPYFGFDILVTSVEGACDKAETLATRIAARLWSEKNLYQRKLTPLESAARLALDAGRAADHQPIVLADIADNPGGGARANTTYIIDALLKSGAENAAVGLFFDPALVRTATQVGIGASFNATLNAEETSPLSKPLTCNAKVIRFVDNVVKNSKGMSQEVPHPIGQSCLLELEERILLAVTSQRRQIFSTDFFEHYGIDINDIRTFVVKSRGHFRAGFEHLVPPNRTYEVDCPGLTTANLENVEWRQLKRPVYPLDKVEDESFLTLRPE